jgi:hypothetical protein
LGKCFFRGGGKAFKESFHKRSRSLYEAEYTNEHTDITWHASSGLLGMKLFPCMLMQVLLSQRVFIPAKSGVSTGMSGRDAAETTFCGRPVSERLSLLQIFCTLLSKVETLNIISVNFQPF